MKVKKYLKKQAEQDRKEILASDNGEFLRELQQQVVPEIKSRPRLRVWLSATISAVAATAVVAICIAVYYPFEAGPIEYLAGNFVSVNSTIEELNQDVKEVDLQIDTSLYRYSVTKTSDSKSGDVLFYVTTIQNTDLFVQMELVTVCNPNYQYKDFQISDETITVQLTNYNVTYTTMTNIDSEFGIEILQAKAEIQKGNEFIYVTKYTEYLFSPEGSFLEVLQSIVK